MKAIFGFFFLFTISLAQAADFLVIEPTREERKLLQRESALHKAKAKFELDINNGSPIVTLRYMRSRGRRGKVPEVIARNVLNLYTLNGNILFDAGEVTHNCGQIYRDQRGSFKVQESGACELIIFTDAEFLKDTRWTVVMRTP